MRVMRTRRRGGASGGGMARKHLIVAA